MWWQWQRSSNSSCISSNSSSASSIGCNSVNKNNSNTVNHELRHKVNINSSKKTTTTTFWLNGKRDEYGSEQTLTVSVEGHTGIGKWTTHSKRMRVQTLCTSVDVKIYFENFSITSVVLCIPIESIQTYIRTHAYTRTYYTLVAVV